MKREEFIETLVEKGYSYKIEGDKIVVTRRRGVDLPSLKILPPGVEFRNSGNVWLESLKTLPPGVVFRNEGYVDLSSLQTISPGVVFRNEGYVDLPLLQTIPPGVEFRNSGDVYLELLIGGWFKDWSGSIKGISTKSLLDKMIADGLFNRR